MKITYIHHSCFIVEIEDCIFVFDYYKGELPKFDPSKYIFFFVSHSHDDHFGPKIYEYAKYNEYVTYIVSDDVRKYFNLKMKLSTGGQNTLFVDDHTNIYVNVDNRGVSNVSSGYHDVKIETLKSTDEGVAFIVEYMGKSIYFAGDLHWWTWIGSPVEEEIFYEKTYLHELSKIKDRHFDAAFVVLDPRQEERYWWGMHEFMKYANPDVVFPMHFWKDYKLIDKFKQIDVSKEYAHKIMSITHEGQVFEI